VVVVGNSRAASDLDAVALEQALGLPDGGVGSLTVPGSSMPTWLALVEHGVYGRGCRPDLLLVYGAVPSLLTREASRSERELYLAELLPGGDPRLGDDPLHAAWTRARGRAAAVRDATFQGLGAGIASLWTGEDGRAALDEATDLVFRGADTQARRVVPIAEAIDGGTTIANRPEDTWFDELAALVAGHGGVVAVVSCPASMENEALAPETLALLDAAAGAVEAAGGVSLDRPAGTQPRAYYADSMHLLPVGARANSAAVGAALVQSGVWPRAGGTPGLADGAAGAGPR